MEFISYAQNFEDVMLWRALKSVSKGFYIDVGAHHPKNSSVTHAFYERGWHGINIEPDRAFIQLLSQERPRDINIDCAVGATEGEMVFWHVDGGGLSTAVEVEAEKRKKEGMSITTETVAVRTLKSICDELVGKQTIHFLKVDVEGFEEQVLLGADFLCYRPWVVVVEATAPMSQEETHEKWEQILLNADYELCYKDGLNRFYLASEKRDLADIFVYPPNFFDRFVLFRDSDSAEIIRLQQELEFLRRSFSWRITRPLRRIKALFR